MPTQHYSYPIDAENSLNNTNKIRFAAVNSSEVELIGSVELYTPMNLTFDDSATYTSIDFGPILGTIYNKTMEAYKASAQNPANGTVQKMIDTFSGTMSSLFADPNMNKTQNWSYLGLRKAGEMFLTDEINGMIDLSMKRALNPHTNMLFDRVKVRTFAFSFQMIAANAQQSETIRNIIEFFRQNLYPETISPGFINVFPPFWSIRFFYGGDENKYIPNIHTCFLTDFSSTINDKANSFHKEGAPFSVSCNMTFTETKTYDKNTILTGNDTDQMIDNLWMA